MHNFGDEDLTNRMSMSACRFTGKNFDVVKRFVRAEIKKDGKNILVPSAHGFSVVCPSDWVIADKDGTYYSLSDSDFNQWIWKVHGFNSHHKLKSRLACESGLMFLAGFSSIITIDSKKREMRKLFWHFYKIVDFAPYGGNPTSSKIIFNTDNSKLWKIYSASKFITTYGFDGRFGYFGLKNKFNPSRIKLKS